MNNLQTEVKEFVIITFTGGHHFITDKQNQYLKNINIGGNININNCIIHAKNIAEILTTKKYYETFPDKRPAPEVKEFMFLSSTVKGFADERRKRALNNIIKGFKKHFEGKIMPENSKKMLDHFLLKV